MIASISFTHQSFFTSVDESIGAGDVAAGVGASETDVARRRCDGVAGSCVMAEFA